MIPLDAVEVLQSILPLVAPHVWRGEMIVEASFSGDWNLSVEALASDAMIQDLGIVRKMAEELREAHKEWLPPF